jgi:hypothetical protein
MWSKLYVVKPKSDEFRDAQSRSETYMQHGTIANSVTSVRNRGVKDTLHLFNGEVLDET